jgi:hypothetical protein
MAPGHTDSELMARTRAGPAASPRPSIGITPSFTSTCGAG